MCSRAPGAAASHQLWAKSWSHTATLKAGKLLHAWTPLQDQGLNMCLLTSISQGEPSRTEMGATEISINQPDLNRGDLLSSPVK